MEVVDPAWERLRLPTPLFLLSAPRGPRAVVSLVREAALKGAA